MALASHETLNEGEENLPDPNGTKGPDGNGKSDDGKKPDPDEEDDYEQNYGDLEDGHDDSPIPESDGSPDNLE